jgi:hypothetical protein
MKRNLKILFLTFLVLMGGFFGFPFNRVRADVDKTFLASSFAQVNSAIAAETDYESSSYQVFFQAIQDVGGVVEIQDVIDDPLALQTDIDALTGVLDAAFAGLVTLATFNAVNASYDTASALELDPYTPDSQTIYLAELARIKDVIDEHTSGEIAIFGLFTDIENADALLVLLAGKTSLTNANNAAIIAYYEERDLYTSSSYDAFKTGVIAYGNYLAVNLLIADANATQASVDAMTVLINEALALLVPKADVSELITALEAANAYDLTGYTPASILFYTNKLEMARAILLGNDTDQFLCDSAVHALLEARVFLVLKADKTDLQTAIEEAGKIKAEKYTVTSYFVLASLVHEAENLLVDENAVQIEVDPIIFAINEATDGLIRLPSDLELTVGSDGINLSEYITLGESSILAYLSSDPSIAGVDALGNVTALNFGTVDITVILANGIVETISIFVKEKVKVVTLVFLLLIPFVSVGLASAMILVKTRPVEILQRIRILRKNKKLPPEPKID